VTATAKTRAHAASASRWVRTTATVPRILGALAALAGAVVLAACGGGPPVTTIEATPTTAAGLTLSTEPSPVGRILTTGAGATLYDFAPDTPTSSACNSASCVLVWPPLTVPADQAPTVGHGLRQSLVGEIRRSDGSTQVTYGGHPLYTWNGDTKPGMVTGQALLNEGGYWYVVAPSGKQITTPFTVDG
jgi:predicted lipoprotein with Yx(FWY)xxD motif